MMKAEKEEKRAMMSGGMYMVEEEMRGLRWWC
jgi:hypothetical protein